MSEIVVADAGPLIALWQIGQLDLLAHRFERVSIPPAVACEIAPSVDSLPRWISIRLPTLPEAALPPRHGLDEGEFRAFALAIELGADLILVDDRKARRWARTHGLPITGTAGIALRAKDEGLVDRVRPILDSLIAHGVFLAPALYRDVLATAGEGPPNQP